MTKASVLYLHFNSIKVRLKQKIINDVESAVRFQFHKGTIKTEKRERKRKHTNISIP